MDIGEPKRVIQVEPEPLTAPAEPPAEPQREPAPLPQPVPEHAPVQSPGGKSEAQPRMQV